MKSKERGSSDRGVCHSRLCYVLEEEEKIKEEQDRLDPVKRKKKKRDGGGQWLRHYAQQTEE